MGGALRQKRDGRAADGPWGGGGLCNSVMARAGWGSEDRGIAERTDAVLISLVTTRSHDGGRAV